LARLMYGPFQHLWEDVRQRLSPPMLLHGGHHGPSEFVQPADIQRVLQRFEHEMAKFGAALCTTPLSELASLLPARDSLFDVYMAVLATLSAIRDSANAGPTLSDDLQTWGGSLTSAIQDLIGIAEQQTDLDSTPDRNRKIAVAVGVVLDRCKKLTKVPLNNSVSVKRHILSCFATVKDAQRELMGEVSRQRELEGNGQQGGEDDMNSHEEGGEAGNGSDDAELDSCDDMMEEDTMTPQQLDVAEKVAELLTSTRELLKETLHALTKGVTAEGSCDGDRVQQLEQLGRHCEDVAARVDEAVQATYPPQELAHLDAIVSRMASSMGQISQGLHEACEVPQDLSSFQSYQTSIQVRPHT